MKQLPLSICMSLLALTCAAQTQIERVARGIIYLEMAHPVWEDAGPNHFEVFYHLPGQTNFIRKIQNSFGTAFFVLTIKDPT